MYSPVKIKQLRLIKVFAVTYKLNHNYFSLGQIPFSDLYKEGICQKTNIYETSIYDYRITSN